jgi:four helix bundle protein
MSVQSYKDLIVWQKALDLVEIIYQVTKTFPKEELYGLTNQLRRAGASIPSNIAEGHARSSTQEFHRFLSIARGSLGEVETQLIIAQRLGYLSKSQLDPILALQTEINKMTNGLMTKLVPSPSSLARATTKELR